MRYSVNHKPVSERTQKTVGGRIRAHYSLSPEAMAALLEMAKVAHVPANYTLDVLIIQGYNRWIEDRAIQKKLEGFSK